MTLCVYALTHGTARVSGTGLAGERLRLVREGPVGAVVGRLSQAPEPSVEMLRRYDGVVRVLADAAPAILPARFGTAFDDPDELRFVLRSRRQTLQRALRHVRGRAQMAVRLVAASEQPVGDGHGDHAGARTSGSAETTAPGQARREAPSQAVKTHSGAGEGAISPSPVSALRRSAGRASSSAPCETVLHTTQTATADVGPGTAFLRGRADAVARERHVPGFDPVRAAVRRWTRDERVERRAGMAIVYHLIPRRSAGVYRRAIERAALEAGLRARVSGPWPPYAFVETW